MSHSTAHPVEVPVTDLRIEALDAQAFLPYGTVMPACEDGKMFGPDEAQLELARGTPRFYVMRLHRREPGFNVITRHLQVTQCLAAVGGGSWFIAVAPPDDPDNAAATPDLARLRAFRVPGDVAIMLKRSTWHAGPFFEPASMDFFNLELADTNQVDHHSCRLDLSCGRAYRFVAAA